MSVQGTFANSFWGGSDYAGGINTLFGKLRQGVQEDQQVLTIARLRADAEDQYATSLEGIQTATSRIDAGFQRDEGASTKKAYDGMCSEMLEASRAHRRIASNIRELVVVPFNRWCDQHANRVATSHDDLLTRLKAHDRQSDYVSSSRSQYYNKCRRLEDLDEEQQLGFQDPKSGTPTSPKSDDKRQIIPTVKLSGPDPDYDDDEPIEIGDESYTPEQVRKILCHALDHIKLGETKVPILGTYQNVSTGADITAYIQLHMNGSSMSYSERIGQDLIDHGFLRLVGNVGRTFANSSRMHYQWRPKVFRITGYAERRNSPDRTSTGSPSDLAFTDNPTVGAVTDLIAGWNPLNNSYPNESPSDKLRREAKESDQRYKAAVFKLDALRCNLEEAMADHFRFMERCERDRLQAIKSVILDFSGAIGNAIPSLQSTIDKMMLFQETVQPLGDLRYLLENYRTGNYVPKVPVYENYYNQVDEQIFGIEIETRARADRKKVPLIVTVLLTFLDHRYPDLEGDEARRGIWLVDVPLSATHHLRRAITTAKSVQFELLEQYDAPVVASLLKLYLLELPDSIVSSHLYEIFKTIYNTTAQTAEDTRVNVIQNTLSQLRLTNIATLDAIMTHFTRLIELTSADEEYVSRLASNLSSCVLRPKHETALSMTERFNVRLIKDLLAHKDEIFGELKRASSLSNNGPGRNRAISTDESQRRANMEERQRAIAAKSRAQSPNRISVNPSAPALGHRRDRSTSAETRFPIATSPIIGSPVERRSKVPELTKMAPKSDHTATSSARSMSLSTADGIKSIEFELAEAGPPHKSHEDDAGPVTSASIQDLGTLSGSAQHTATAQDDVDQARSSSPASGDGGPAAPIASSSVRNSVDGPEKRNSLTRSRGVVARKVTGGQSQQRSSMISKRDSVGSNASNGHLADAPAASTVEPEAGKKKGVELTDAPMDDD